jgi:hypothetical protein
MDDNPGNRHQNFPVTTRVSPFSEVSNRILVRENLSPNTAFVTGDALSYDYKGFTTLIWGSASLRAITGAGTLLARSSNENCPAHLPTAKGPNRPLQCRQSAAV